MHVTNDGIHCHMYAATCSRMYTHTCFQMYDVEDNEFDKTEGTKEKIKNLAGDPTNFSAIHPFLFMVEDNTSGAILLFGRVLNPTVKSI